MSELQGQITVELATALINRDARALAAVATKAQGTGFTALAHTIRVEEMDGMRDMLTEDPNTIAKLISL